MLLLIISHFLFLAPHFSAIPGKIWHRNFNSFIYKIDIARAGDKKRKAGYLPAFLLISSAIDC